MVQTQLPIIFSCDHLAGQSQQKWELWSLITIYSGESYQSPLILDSEISELQRGGVQIESPFFDAVMQHHEFSLSLEVLSRHVLVSNSNELQRKWARLRFLTIGSAKKGEQGRQK